MSIMTTRMHMQSQFQKHNYGRLSEEQYNAVSELQAKISDFHTTSQAEFMSGTTNIVSSAQIGLGHQQITTKQSQLHSDAMTNFRNKRKMMQSANPQVRARGTNERVLSQDTFHGDQFSNDLHHPTLHRPLSRPAHTATRRTGSMSNINPRAVQRNRQSQRITKHGGLIQSSLPNYTGRDTAKRRWNMNLESGEGEMRHFGNFDKISLENSVGKPVLSSMHS